MAGCNLLGTNGMRPKTKLCAQSQLQHLLRLYKRYKIAVPKMLAKEEQ